MSAIDFTVPFQVDKLGPNPKRIHLDATADEIEALRERFDLQTMNFLKGQVMLQRLQGKKIECRFEVDTEVTQQCVVTFKPVTTRISLEFTRIYDETLKGDVDEKEVEIDIEATEELDPIIDGVIDLGAAVSEELGLEIDPFPRAEGTEFKEFGVGPEITKEEVQESNPFSVLADLKNKNQ
ncbi:DUF177 domain-containing protein [Terasakiella sp. A23]|uniref:YceD family protein n=1 Tax=Terasakiella sp. FCG-A23 TaxID=3080561 RepID=UPI00295495B9|nr:DUF177 domain-containing protein [Terasakiella sp. A23]MDV7338647.1 DUF177 domain-containing protein [Terasakiella sp. A23]